MTLVNLDQALRDIMEQVFKEQGSVLNLDYGIMECMRRAYRLAESKEEMMKMIGGPAVSALKEEAGE